LRSPPQRRYKPTGWAIARASLSGGRGSPTLAGRPPPWFPPLVTPPSCRYGAALASLSALATLRGWAGTATVGGDLERKPTKCGPRYQLRYVHSGCLGDGLFRTHGWHFSTERIFGAFHPPELLIEEP
jgi:hypothetical protein